MRLAVVTESRDRVGGVEAYLESILPALGARHDVAFWSASDDLTERGAIRLPAGILAMTLDLSAADRLHRLRSWRPDLLFAHGLNDPALEEPGAGCRAGGGGPAHLSRHLHLQLEDDVVAGDRRLRAPVRHRLPGDVFSAPLRRIEPDHNGALVSHSGSAPAQSEVGGRGNDPVVSHGHRDAPERRAPRPRPRRAAVRGAFRRRSLPPSRRRHRAGCSISDGWSHSRESIA